MDNVIWKPHPGPQTLALSTGDVYETLFGGSRGGGKTDTALVWLLRATTNPRFRGLVIRRTADDLSDWVSRAKRLYASANATVSGKPAVIKFPNGAEIRCGHLRDTDSYEKYQGHEYQRMVIEELGQIPNEESYLKLLSSCRSTVKGLEPQVFCTANPGGKGHAWIKMRWRIGELEPNKAFPDPISKRYRMYIPARVFDNPTLLKMDPDYIHYLESLPEPLRSAWLHGDWDVFAGLYFTEYHPDIHIISEDKARELGYGHAVNNRYTGIDWGYANPFCCLWNEVTPGGTVFFYRELYGTERHPMEWGELIANHSRNEGITMHLGDPSMWIRNPMSWRNPSAQMHSDKSIADSLMGSGVTGLVPANNSRVSGWQNMAQLMHFSEKQRPRLYIIRGTCPNLERTIPMMLRDEKNPEDIDTTLEDHALDSARYSLTHIQSPIYEKKKLSEQELEIQRLIGGVVDDGFNWEFE